MKKAASLTLSLLLALGLLAGCSSESSSSEPSQESIADSSVAEVSTPDESSTTEPAGDGTVYQIGVSQLVTHPALDATYQGFVDALADAGYEQDVNINIDYQNAHDDQSVANTIASKFANDGKDLVLAIATPAAQAMANASSEIPILITAVTDPVGVGLAESMEAPGGNISGTSDLNPVREQMELLVELVPDAKVVGMIFNSSEDNSRVQIDMATAVAEELGLEVKEYTVSSSNDVQQVAQSMVGNVDAVYAPTDNTIASSMSIVAQVCNAAGIPTIVGEEGMVDNGGLASWSISYYQLGYITGQQAVQVLEGADISTLPIQMQSENLAFVYNEETAELLEIEIPESLKALVD